MSAGSRWDEIYRDGGHGSVWPWTELVSLVMRYARPRDRKLSVYEFGCGPGANIPLFLSCDADYFSVEGSPTAVARVHECYPQLRQQVVCGDFTAEQPFDVSFDLCVDRASLPHNDRGGVARGLELAMRHLKPGGLLIGVDWFSTEFSEFQAGESTEDHYVRRNFRDGRLAGIDLTQFFDAERLRDLLVGFEIELLEHRVRKQIVPSGDHQYAAWDFVARKPL